MHNNMASGYSTAVQHRNFHRAPRSKSQAMTDD